MKTQSIEELAYFLKEAKEAKEANNPAPIFFLGAGASKSGGIPLAGEIIEDILENHCDNPLVKKLKKDEQTYAKLMECLSPHARNKLLKGYIDKAKINVPHIYLAQLMINGFADYILTVNFDNLMLRALALFNEFPPTYDMAILEDITTTSFKTRSVVYLHGQHHGLWLLNTKEEMAKVNKVIPRVLHKITSERPWIFIGYSGDDPIFDHIQKEIRRFDHGLYWVSYEGNTPSKKVKDFLETPNTNAYLIEGSYDADSFMLKLNSELGLKQPNIINKPFSALQSSLNQIVDIDNEDHFKGVKERLEIAKRNVNDAIQQYEKNETKAGALEKEIIELIIHDDYLNENKITEVKHRAEKLNNDSINENLAALLFNWGFFLNNLAQTKSGNEADELYQQACDKYANAIKFKNDDHEAYYNWGNALNNLAQTKSSDKADKLYQQACDKYAKAIEFKQDKHEAYSNWGNTLSQLAQTKSGDKADKLYQQAFEKYAKAIEFKQDKHEAYYNWGLALYHLAQTKSGDKADKLYQQACEKYANAIKFKNDDHEAYYNWGLALYHLAQTKSGNKADELYQQACEKYAKAIEFKQDFHEVYNNWGNALSNLAQKKSDDKADKLYQQAYDKYAKAIEFKQDYHEVYYNWGNTLSKLAQTKSGSEADALYQQAFKKLKQASALGGRVYNLACIYSLTGDRNNAFKYLKQALNNKEITADFVKDDTDWKDYQNDKEFKKLLEEYKNS